MPTPFRRNGRTRSRRASPWDLTTVRLFPRRVPQAFTGIARSPSTDTATQGGFDAAFYTSFYNDLRSLDPESAKRHFNSAGRREGRISNADTLLSDLQLEHGPLPDDFDEASYHDRYPDVRERFPFDRSGAYHYLRFGQYEGRSWAAHSYDEKLLHLVTNRVHDLPEVQVDGSEPARVNVLVPAFDFSTMSAGFFGVFQVARFISQQGLRVRLVMFDNFYWNETEFRARLHGYPDMEKLFDELEVEYIGERRAPLRVSPRDNCVATVWYSAYLARKVQQATDPARPFLYLIQDYESDFFAGSSLRALAEATYRFNYSALFSTQALMSSFEKKRIGNFDRRAPWSRPRCHYFNNACASSLLDKERFLEPPPVHSLAFYSRPQVSRNMFELGALALIRACDEGVFDESWRFFGVGIGDLTIDLGGGRSLEQLPRVNLRDYQQMVARFDIGLSLMASPHPSLLPFDLGGSGALVVTNTYGVKTQRYFKKLCGNVIAREPSLDAIVDGLRTAVSRSVDREKRYMHASSMTYPTSWQDTFGRAHSQFIKRAFHESLDRQRTP